MASMAGILRQEIKNPLNAPQAAPTKTAMSTATPMGRFSFCIRSPATMPHKFATYTQERSMPPEIIQIPHPTAISPYSDNCFPIVWKTGTFRKELPFVTPAMSKNATSMISRRITLSSIFFSLFMPLHRPSLFYFCYCL